MTAIDASVLTKAELQTLSRLRSFNPRQFFGTGLLMGVGLFALLVVLSNMGLLPSTILDLRQANNDGYLMGCYAVSLAIGFSVAYVMTKPAGTNRMEKELARLHYKERVQEKDRIQAEQNDPEANAWKDQIAQWLSREYPDVTMVRSDATLAHSRYCALPLPIDFVFPDLGLAVQANVEAWNNIQAYQEDLEFETFQSDSLYLSSCCAKKGITLVHVWDSMSMEQIKAAISQAMEECDGHVPLSARDQVVIVQ